jgi:hypothetical protein
MVVTTSVSRTDRRHIVKGAARSGRTASRHRPAIPHTRRACGRRIAVKRHQDVDVQSLITLLDRLARALNSLRDDLRIEPALIETWSDVEHHYLDAPMPELEGHHLDVCVRDGRLFLTAAREDGDA